MRHGQETSHSISQEPPKINFMNDKSRLTSHQPTQAVITYNSLVTEAESVID